MILDSTQAVRHWSTPTIIDTRTMEFELQDAEPWTGAIDTIKPHLPVHSRDKSLPAGQSESLPLGATFEASRVMTDSNFPAISQTQWAPPDPTLAVGPNHIVETVNSRISFFDKAGNLQFTNELGDAGSPGFFEGQGAEGFVFDPKCMYDHNTGRFIVVVLEVYDPSESYIDIAVSDDSDPNGVWYKYRTNSVVQVGDNEYWVDYPGIGFDDNAWYVTGNLFKLNGPSDDGFAGPLFRIFDKTPMLSGLPVQISDIVPDFNSSVQVAQSYGTAPRCYFLSRSSSSSLRIWSIENALSGSPTLETTTVDQLADAFSPSDSPNLNGDLISTLDGRLMNVHWRDGNLYAAHGIDDNGGSGNAVARWYRISTNGWPASGSNPVLAEQGEVEGTGSQSYFFPAIVSDSSNNVGMVMARSASNEFASVQVSGRTPSDPAGTMSAPVQLSIGDAGYNGGRWGDYFDITIDPTDDRTMWVVGMYAKDFGWQTWIGSFTVGAACEPDLAEPFGVLNLQDVFAYLALFNAQDPSADLAAPFGTFNLQDVFAYLNLFNSGCP